MSDNDGNAVPHADTQDLFAHGCLVLVAKSKWTGRCKVASAAVLDPNAHVNPDAIAATKRLVEKSALQDIDTIDSETAAWVEARALPFPIPGFRFIPAAATPAAHEFFTEQAARRARAVAQFCADLDSYKETARGALGPLYDPEDYPEDMAARFAFTWRFLTLSPAGERQLLDPALVAEANAGFRALLASAQTEAVAALRAKFAECVDHTVERLGGTRDGGKPMIFRDSLITNLQEFVDGFATLNIAGDADLAALVERTRALIGGADPGDLRTDAQYRERIAISMAQVQARLDDMMVERPTRKLRLGPSTPVTPNPNPEQPAAPAGA